MQTAMQICHGRVASRQRCSHAVGQFRSGLRTPLASRFKASMLAS